MNKIFRLISGVSFLVVFSACAQNTTKNETAGLFLTNNPDFDWQIILDSTNGGNSTGEVKKVDGRTNQPSAIRLDYVLKEKYQYRNVIAALIFGKVQDWSQSNGLKFWLKGSGHKLRVVLITPAVNDYDFHGFVLDATPAEWKEITIPFSAIKQEGWGKPVAFNPAQILELDLKTASAQKDEKGFFLVDDFRVINDPVSKGVTETVK
jgi:hypothetical protein